MMIDDFVIDHNMSLLSALKYIDSNKKGFVTVVDNDSRCVGVLTDGDVRRALIAGSSLDDSIGSVVSEVFTFILNDTEISEAIKKFSNESIKFIPVLDKDRHIVNIIERQNLYSLLLQDIHPDIKYDFSKCERLVMDHDIVLRPWGFFKTTLLSKGFKTKIINVRPGAVLSLQSHSHREEYWVIVHGSGVVTLDQSKKRATQGSIIFIPKGCKHRISNDSSESLIFIEVQQGDYLEEDDIIRYEDNYGRV